MTPKFTDKLFHYSLDPLIVNVANPGIKFTTVLFAKQTDCLLVGDSDGQVAVYELKHMPTASDTGRVRLRCKTSRSFVNPLECDFVVCHGWTYIWWVAGLRCMVMRDSKCPSSLFSVSLGSLVIEDNNEKMMAPYKDLRHCWEELCHAYCVTQAWTVSRCSWNKCLQRLSTVLEVRTDSGAVPYAAIQMWALCCPALTKSSVSSMHIIFIVDFLVFLCFYCYCKK